MKHRSGSPIAARVGAAILLVCALALGPARAEVFDPKTFTLDNGLQVVLVENHSVPAVVQMLWYKVGSADEPRGKSGIAHFLEHLMFKGTEAVPAGEFSKIVAQHGGRDNAFTTRDYTGYFQVVAADRLGLVMEMEADRMANLRLTDELVLPERDVILEERRSRIDNSPAAQLGEAMNAALYLHHPYRLPVIGWESEIAALTTDDALAFYERHYAPNNAILVVAGDVTLEELRPLAEKHYGPLEARDVPPRVRTDEPPHLASRRVVLRSDQVREPSWRRSYLAPSYTYGDTADPYALQVLSELLGGGPTSRLHRGVVLDEQVGAAAGSWYDPNAIDMSTFGIYGVPRQGQTVEAIEAAIEQVLATLVREGVTEEEVASAKQRLQAAATFARDSLQTGARVLGEALVTGRSIEDVESWPERIAAVTVEEVETAARSVFKEERSVTGLLLPDPAPAPVAEAEPMNPAPPPAESQPPASTPTTPAGRES